jgi:hypothetical protein
MSISNFYVSTQKIYDCALYSLIVEAPHSIISDIITTGTFSLPALLTRPITQFGKCLLVEQINKIALYLDLSVTNLYYINIIAGAFIGGAKNAINDLLVEKELMPYTFSKGIISGALIQIDNNDEHIMAIEIIDLWSNIYTLPSNNQGNYMADKLTKTAISAKFLDFLINKIYNNITTITIPSETLTVKQLSPSIKVAEFPIAENHLPSIKNIMDDLYCRQDTIYIRNIMSEYCFLGDIND